MTAVLEQDEASGRLVLVTEKDLTYFVLIAFATHLRTRLAAEPDALVFALEPSLARLVARRSIALLPALLRAPQMLTLVRAWLSAWRARLRTLLVAFRVHAAVFTIFLTRHALIGTRCLSSHQ